ncbi:CDP-glycerol glycerophosphotransferase family protein [Sporolactobacillus shoreicorticis]|uniref:CDP-glycerol glycerophosphotransferase family protein n=1 Tax=Sporolactobacillus shoreicorticis TaxID=1923877 RepID=A0ABW5S399_9BACL|nr:CDP-glycerol glycerophosphotransferase family protein [Sporolactobacillus shoreicorticis]MCO7124317.1 CDP-glycerol glycerophosphotransferase family protein [Sporolactobacillus shoreicorticis]
MLAKRSFLSRRKGIFRYFSAIVLAKLLSPFFYFQLKKKKIALIGGHCGEKYADNAAALHHYLRANFPDYTVYFGLSNKRAAIRASIDGPVYQLGSVWNYLLYSFASVCYYSHSLESDIAPEIDFSCFSNRKLIKVYLGHGIDGLKKNLFIFDTRRSNYFICSSHQEAVIKNNDWGIPKEKLIVTGMPRYDALYMKRSQGPSRTILYMPTWREWLNADQIFFESCFYKQVTQLLNDRALADVLKQHRYQLKVMLHPFLHSVFKTFKQNNNHLDDIIFCQPDQSIQDLIVECDLLITDYSSVSWDFYYLNKPVLFFQFDQAEYLEKRGAYLDFSKELFGDVVFLSDEVAKKLDRILSLDRLSDYYKNQVSQKNHFDFYDHKNCLRIVQHTLPGYQESERLIAATRQPDR